MSNTNEQEVTCTKYARFCPPDYCIGKYSVSSMCMRSYPCVHEITDTATGEQFNMDGIIFYKLITSQGLSHPHFDEYKEPCCNFEQKKAPLNTSFLAKLKKMFS